MTDEKDATERVTMIWPSELKTRLREHTGQRGMTAFTITAVEAALNQAGVKVEAKPAKAEPKLESEPVVAEKVAPEERKPVEQRQPTPVARPVAELEANQPAVIQGRKVEDSALPGDVVKQHSSSTDVLQEMLAKASQLGLKRASEIEVPAPPAQPVEESAEEATSDDQQKCFNCGEPLIDGECWNCF